MTREEAIQVLTDIKRIRSDKIAREAIDMAIALSVANLKEEFESAEYEDYEHATLVDIKEPLRVLVVRCKDCRHWNSETKGCKRNPSVEAWYETDFCKYGERQCNYFGERREPTE